MCRGDGVEMLKISMLTTAKIKILSPLQLYFNELLAVCICAAVLQISIADHVGMSITSNGTNVIGTYRNISCRVNSSSASVWWSLNDKNVSSEWLGDQFSQQATLVFHNVSFDDFNNYTCNALLPSGKMLNDSYSLYFAVDQKIEIRGLKGVLEGSSVDLSCTVRGFPLLHDIHWRRGVLSETLTNSTQLTIQNSSHSPTEHTSKLAIVRAEAYHNGSYYCQVGNAIGETTLLVKSIPVIHFDVLKAVGKSSIFLNWTIFNGNSPLTELYLKYKNKDKNETYTVNINPEMTEYLLQNLTPLTVYENILLEAINEVGVGTSNNKTTSTLSNDPKFVPNVSVKGYTSNTLTLRWNDPHNMTEFYHYYNVSVRTKLGTFHVYKTSENPYLVEHLNPGTEYLLQVQACSSFTHSCDAASEIVNGTTMDGMSSAPRNISVQCNFDGISHDSTVRATWEAPESPQGKIVEYLVVLTGGATYFDGDGRQSEDKIGPINRTIMVTQPRKVEFSNQPPNTHIFVSVCAKTRTRMCGYTGEGSCSTPASIPDEEELSKANWKAVQRNKNQQIFFMVTLPHISQRNGSICCFRVVVVRLKNQDSLKDLKPPNLMNILTYDEVHKGNNGGAYVAEMLDSSSRNIMIGDNTLNGEEKRYPCHKCWPPSDYSGFTGSFRRTQNFPRNAPEEGKKHRKRHASSNIQLFSGPTPLHPKDGPLDSDSTYTAYLDAIVLNDKHEQMRAQSRYFDPLRPIRLQEAATGSVVPGIAVIGSLVVALVVVLMALMCVMRWRRKEPGDQEYGLSHSIQQWCRRFRGQQRIPSDEPPNLPPIPKDQIVTAYIDRHKDSDYGFQQEFESLPDRFCDRTSNASDMRENIGKNRYPDIKAYDQTRVRLSILEGGPDYINANIVVGYKERKKFVCAQGPMESTVVDWWRMIWEQRVHLILMLTNVEEYNKTKCAKYWPSEGSINYGDMMVTHYGEKRFSDYLVRNMKLNKNHADANAQDEGVEEEREITQYHYLVWKDFMAPEHPVGILRFIKRFNEVYTLEKGPILVHCSAGVGRTGTLVALDSLLQQMAEEGCASIFNTICDLRHQRNYLVQSLKQYIFIYRALMEVSQFNDTEVSIMDLKSTIEKLKGISEEREISPMQEEYERLTCVIEDRKPISVGTSEENRHRNRHEIVIPYDRSRVILSPMPGLNKEICTYINASFIEGYDNSEQFIIAQDPLDITVGDFWRMIVEQNVRSVVMLSDTGDDKCPRYWPEKDQETSHDYIKVKYMQSQSFPFYYRREFTVTNTKTEDSYLVTQFQYNGWPVGEGEVPQVDRGIVELINTTFKHKEILEKNCGPMVVHCSDGADRSCIFVALSILVQQLMNESRVDVFSVVRKLRSQRQGLFKNFAQYEFIYRGLVTFAELHVSNGTGP